MYESLRATLTPSRPHGTQDALVIEDSAPCSRDVEPISSIGYVRSNTGEIRLLKLSPASEDRIHRTLECTRLVGDSSGVLFAALSYHWTNASKIETIQTGGRRRLMIQPTRYQALTLPRNEGTRTLWIDAISINQANISKSTQQARGMATTYSTASQVVISLMDSPAHSRSDTLDERMMASFLPWSWSTARLTPSRSRRRHLRCGGNVSSRSRTVTHSVGNTGRSFPRAPHSIPPGAKARIYVHSWHAHLRDTLSIPPCFSSCEASWIFPSTDTSFFPVLDGCDEGVTKLGHTVASNHEALSKRKAFILLMRQFHPGGKFSLHTNTSFIQGSTLQDLTSTEGGHMEALPDRYRFGTSESMNSRATQLLHHGRYLEAEVLFRSVIERQRELLGEKHSTTLESMSNLASTYWNLGKWKEAEYIFAKVVTARIATLGARHPSTLTAMRNLGATYKALGRWWEAMVLAAKVLEASVTALGNRHPDTLAAMANLALMYWKQGRREQAETLDLHVLNVRRKILGPIHPDTIQSMANLAYAYNCCKRYEEAAQLSLRVLEVRRQVLGDEHPDTLKGMIHLALTHQSLGLASKAESLLSEATNGCRKILGAEHPLTLATDAKLLKLQHGKV